MADSSSQNRSGGSARNPAPPQRRSFLVRAAACVAGAIVGVFPFLAGLGVVLNPVLPRRGSEGDSDQNVQRSSQPFMVVTKAVARPR